MLTVSPFSQNYFDTAEISIVRLLSRNFNELNTWKNGCDLLFMVRM